MAVVPSQPPAVLGIDVGGTKTHLAMGVDGRIRDERYVDSTAWRTDSYPHNAQALHRLVVNWLGEQAIGWPLAVGSHGCDTSMQCDSYAAELRRYFTGPLRVVNDAELLVPAAGITDGIGLVAGTGAIAVARDRHGNLLAAGGWGWVLGDEGSSAGLIREAARAVLDRLDLGAPPDLLGQRLMAAFGATEGPELALAITTADSAAWLGSHAGLVFRAADDGSALAGQVIAQAGADLAALVDRLIRRGVPATEVVAGGSVILSQPRLRRAFLDALRARHPSSTVHFLDGPPVRGAVALATRLTTSLAGGPPAIDIGTDTPAAGAPGEHPA